MHYDHDLMKSELERDEGRRSWAYLDTEQNWTVGIGHLLRGDELTAYVQNNKPYRKLSPPEIDAIYQIDITRAEGVLSKIIPNWKQLDDVRQRALLNLAFNLGNRLRGFVKFLDAVDEQDWERAGHELKDSKWWGQVGDRADRLWTMIVTGEAP